MKIVNFSDLTQVEVELLKKTKKVAEKTVSDIGHKVGCVIRCKDGEEFVGATNIRSRTIGSTCAERMALDQMYFGKNRNPELCVIIGRFPNVKWRKKWSDDNICTPCGVCLEMFLETTHLLGIKDLNFLCVSWNKKKVLRATLSELFPQVNEDGK